MRKQWSLREFITILHNNGYQFKRRGKGSHQIFSDGVRTIAVQYTQQNPYQINKIIKGYGLKIL